MGVFLFQISRLFVKEFPFHNINIQYIIMTLEQYYDILKKIPSFQL